MKNEIVFYITACVIFLTLLWTDVLYMLFEKQRELSGVIHQYMGSFDGKLHLTVVLVVFTFIWIFYTQE